MINEVDSFAAFISIDDRLWERQRVRFDLILMVYDFLRDFSS